MFQVYVLSHDSKHTKDFRTDRVRIFTGDDGKVLAPPRTGWTAIMHADTRNTSGYFT